MITKFLFGICINRFEPFFPWLYHTWKWYYWYSRNLLSLIYGSIFAGGVAGFTDGGRTIRFSCMGLVLGAFLLATKGICRALLIAENESALCFRSSRSCKARHLSCYYMNWPPRSQNQHFLVIFKIEVKLFLHILGHRFTFFLKLLFCIFKIKCETAAILSVRSYKTACSKTRQDITAWLQIKQFGISIKRNFECYPNSIDFKIVFFCRGIREKGLLF